LEIADDRKKIAKTRCIVATPGRCLHLLQNKVINTSEINLLVLDEADNLITNDSMKSDILKIYDYLGAKKQVLAVSATFENGCDKVLCKLMKNPVGVTPRKEIPILKGVKQFVRTIANQADNIKEMFSKVEQLKKILSSVQFKQCLVFVNSQMRADSYNVYLNRAGHPCEVICGSQDQKKRLQVLERLKSFKCRVLLATDLMARGIDVENVNLIVNLEIPYDSSTYLHRIGRAGRYGSHGIAITVLQENELEKFQRMLGEIGREGMSSTGL
jgi:ATP-dependent RNA helicase DDX20